MTSRKMSFFEFWRRKKDRGELLRRTNQLRLLPSQLRLLLSDSGVRAALSDTRFVSLLPPVGTEVFRHFTPDSLGEIERRQEEEREKRKNKEVAENHLPKPASDLEAGKPLPFIYGDPPPELLNIPLEELDPYYQSQKTFIVLSKGNILHRFDAEPACYLLSPFSLLRRVAIRILTHSFFSFFILMTILTNCVSMTLSDPPAWTWMLECVFTAIYTFETVVKVVSRGFCLRNFTFVRDPWNWLDIIVISMAYLSLFVNLGRVSVLKTIPRVLKMFTVISGLKMTVGALVKSLKRLAGVFVLTVFCLSILALIGLQFFMGSLKHKCYIMLHQNFTFNDFETGNSSFDFTEYLNNHENMYYLPGQSDALLCGNSSDSGICPEGYTCMRSRKNPNYGFTSFDSFGWSLLSVFRLMTQDFFENLLELMLRAEGKSSTIFFTALVFPCCFCVLSLILTVVTMVTGEWEEASIDGAKQKEEEFNQIMEALKRRKEEEQAACRTESSASNTAIEGSQGDHRSCPPCWLNFVDLFLKWNCCGCLRQLKLRLFAFVSNPFFNLGIIILLILNIIFMAMEHFPMTPDFEELLSVGEVVFTAIFTAEMVLKLVALSPYGYFQVGWNIFESIIVIFSLVELSCDFPRCFRLLRLFRLARWWPSFHMFLKVMWTMVWTLRNLTLVLLIMVFIFSVAGMQLFQKNYKDCVCRISQDCELPRWHMSDFFHTLLVIFRILCGQWIETLWDCMEVSGQTVCLIFFMLVVVIGYLLILNLFLTLLMGSFSSEGLPNLEEKNNLNVAKSQISGVFWTLLGKKNVVAQTAANIKEDNSKEYLALSFVTSDQSEGEAVSYTSSYQRAEPQRAPVAEIETENEEEKENKGDDDCVQKEEEDRKRHPPEDCCSEECYQYCRCLNIDTSQGGGRVWSNFRRVCLSIVQHQYFEIFMIIIILLSSAALVFEDIHLPQRQTLKTVVVTADQVFTYLFLLEMLLKWIAFGLKKYFTSAWCWLDFLILDVSLLSLTASMFGFSELEAFLRTLRALMPLRVLSRFQSLRVVVQTLVRTIPPMVELLLVFLTVWLAFCILGVNLFGGKFYYCFNETSQEIFLPEEVGNKSECWSLVMHNFTEVRWKNMKFNYDDVWSGYLSLLVAASAHWFDVMYAAVDAREVESQPAYESQPVMYLYFFCFKIISGFFILNVFIRTIIDKLQRDKFGGKLIFMTDKQREYFKAVKNRFCMKPHKPAPRPQNQCQAQLYDLVTSVWFEVFMVVVICANMVTLMMETDEQSSETEIILHWFHFAFIIIFLTEFILKIIVLRQHYFKDSFNVLDFVVIIISIVGLFLSDFLVWYFVTPSIFSVLRLVRISRVIHLFGCTRGIQKLLSAFIMALPALFNIGCILFLILFIFSVFGMFNFAYVKKEVMISDMLNFETFGNSIICLFMVTMSTTWPGLLLPIMDTPPDCDPDIENPGLMVRGNCGNPRMGIVFFTTYIFLNTLLVIQLYIAVILETFDIGNTKALSDSDLQMFYKTWRKFDHHATHFIQYSQLSDFCNTLKDPLRIPKPNTIKLIHMNLPLLPGDKIHCVDIFLALVSQVLADSEEMDALKARMEEKFMADSSKMSYEPISSTLRRKQEEVAATVIQKAFRKHLLQLRNGGETAVIVCGDGVSSSSHLGGALQ